MYCLTHGVIQRSVPVRFHLKSDLAALNLRSSFLDFGLFRRRNIT